MKGKKIFTEVVSNVVLVVLVLGVVAVGFYGAVSNVFSADNSQPIYKGNTKSNYVTLMINVYWGTEYIDDILETLERYDAKTTFFVGGSWAIQNGDVLKKIADSGHEIGNHGYHHKDHDKLSYNQNISEIETTHKVVNQLINTEMTLFAPPSGAFSSNTVSAAKSLGYKTIMWSRDTIDWRDKDKDVVLTRATKNISGGDLILMHPTEHTLAALEQILQHYLLNGLEVVPVSKNIS